ncbi:MAG: alpha/beta hydrolase [Bdellovibrionales bacterium]|jgi:hypothetical protein
MKIIRILAALALAYLVAVTGVFVFQRSFLYFPNDTYVFPETLDAKSPLKEFPVKTEDGLVLKGWYAPPKSQPISIVYFHGNADSLETVAPIAALYLADGYGFLIVEYRGYSKLPGLPTEKGLYADARAFVKKLIATGVKEKDIVFIGHSLGTGVAVQMASEFHVKGLGLIAPFMSISEMARRRFPYLPAYYLALDRYENFKKIPSLHVPLFIAHGQKDMVIPFSDGKNLFALGNEPKKFFYSPESGHNDLYAHGLYPFILDWLRQLVSKDIAP